MDVSKRKTGDIKKLNRKQIRKRLRREKRERKNEWFMKRGKNNQKNDGTAESETLRENFENDQKGSINKKGTVGLKKNLSKTLTTEEQQKKEQKQQKKLEMAMQKQRKDQLIKANRKEDQTIRKLEKQLKLHKRKTKSIPKSFSSDGLDFLLEVCDPEYMVNSVNAEQDLTELNDNFEEDLALMTDEKPAKKRKNTGYGFDDNTDNLSNEDEISGEENELNFLENESLSKLKPIKTKRDKTARKRIKKSKIKVEEEKDEDLAFDVDLEFVKTKKSNAKKKLDSNQKSKTTKSRQRRKMKLQNEDIESEEDDGVITESTEDADCSEAENKQENDANDSKECSQIDGVWEDIYGRLRGKDGSVLSSNSEEKYIPPAIRAKIVSAENKKREEKLLKLKRQLKGLLNRLAESNMHSIASQIEDLYMNNSRNDMNETLTSLLMDSLVSNVTTSDRLLMEHVLLIAVLHANVGTEVGAHFLQIVVKKFESLTRINQDMSNKSLDNTVNILAQLYNFKVFEAKLLYEILHRLSQHFEEKNIDCILNVLRNVGFGLRKDDPLALKNLIVELQTQASSASLGNITSSRIKYLLDILLAIKNNNMTKIPNYDPTYSDHLKKIMKGFVRKGNYVTQLNISLEDLLKADERGKWWVVGSAWTGKADQIEKNDYNKVAENFSHKLLDLARKQRMNTDTRRDIFCIIMSAEDFVDAFEKLLRLGLKNQQEREIIHVILHCCLQEKVYNPYYAVLAQKFCEYDRKFQMTIKYSAWDKLKALGEHFGNQISNLAKLLTHLFIEQGLPISTLKIVEFSELDKITLRFIRQILLGILLHNDTEQIQQVFLKIAHSEKLKMFRESLRLFIHHFVLRNLKTEGISEEKKKLLEERAADIEKILSIKESRLRL